MAVSVEGMLDNAVVEQTDEILALQSIYEENFRLIQEHDQNKNTCIEFSITLNIHHPYEHVRIEALINNKSDSTEFEMQENLEDDAQNNDSQTLDDGKVVLKASSNEPSTSSPNQPSNKKTCLHLKGDFSELSPLNLWCRFPSLYPVRDPPQAIISCDWLSNDQIEKLASVLNQLWQENCFEPIVFTWADWLQNSLWVFLELPSHIILSEGLKDRNDGFTNVASEMSTLNIFLKGKPICEICFETKEGKEFFWFDKCYHFCCLECLKLHCEMHIQSGSILQLLCPINDCDTAVPHGVLKGILSEDFYMRWERLLLSKTLDMMSDLFYCPRCDTAVVAHEDVAKSRLGQCASCYYAFCTECHGPWHYGDNCMEDLEKENDKIKEGEVKASAATVEIREREQKKQVAAFNMLIMEMKRRGLYKKCPKCQTAIEKDGGCNHMHCTQCQFDFCWDCEKPYHGYNSCTGHDTMVALLPPPPEPTEGEIIIENYKIHNPGQKVRTKNCPTCSQKILKEANNNHLKCWSCKTQFCYMCSKRIQGVTFKHFIAPSTCIQHSDD